MSKITITNQGSTGGGAGTPGGSATQVQFNDAGAFGGDSGFGYDKTNNRLGVNQGTPIATIHGGAGSYTVGNTSNFAIASYSGLTTGGLSFSTIYTYDLYGKRTVTKSDSSSKTIFSTTKSNLSSTAYSIIAASSSGTANYAGTGYTADGTDFSFTVWPLYATNTKIGGSAGYSVSQDSSMNPYSIDHDIVPPTPALYTPSAYFIRRDVDDNWQVVAGDFSDDNSAWNADATTQLATYIAFTGLQHNLSWTAASNADDYRLLNITSVKWIDKGSTGTTGSDVGLWTAGTPATTPNGPLTDIGIISDGDSNILGDLKHTGRFVGFYSGAPIVQPVGNIVAALGSLNLVSGASLPPTSMVGSANQIVYIGSNGIGTQNPNLIFLNSGLGFGFGTKSVGPGSISPDSIDVATQMNFRIGATYASATTFSNTGRGTSSHIYSDAGGTTTFTGFESGTHGQILFVTNGPFGTIAFSNESASSSAANRINTGFGATLTCTTSRTFAFVYDKTNARWRLLGGDGQALTSAANSWTGTSNTFSSLVQLQGGLRLLQDYKTGNYTVAGSNISLIFQSGAAAAGSILLPSAIQYSTQIFKNTGKTKYSFYPSGTQRIDEIPPGSLKINEHDSVIIAGALGSHYVYSRYYRPLKFTHITDSINSGTGETDLYSGVVPVGLMGVNGEVLRAQYAGTFLGDATSTQRLKAYFAGSNIFDTGALGIGAATTYWDMVVTLIRSSASGVRCSAALNTSFATLNSYATYTNIGSLNWETGSHILKITGQAAGVTGSSGQITASEGYVEFVPLY